MNSVDRSFRQLLREHESALWLILIMVTAAWLRFRGLDAQSYWFDELFSAHYSRPDHDIATVITLTLGDVHPPFYQLMMWLSYKVIGFTEWAGRFPSAVAGLAAVWGIYMLGRELFGSRAGLYAAALATVNYYLLYYSQEARSYAFLYALCTLSFLFFVRALRSDSKANLTAYVVATLLLLYTHYFGFLVLLAEGVALLIYMQSTGWRERAVFIRGLFAAAVIAVCILPLLPIITGHAAIDDFWITQPDAGFIFVYVKKYFYTWVIALPVLLAVLAGIVGGLWPRQSGWQRTAVLMLLAWVVLGYALPWLRGFIGQPVITDRNTVMQLPVLLVLAGYGLTFLRGDWLQRAVLTGLVGYSLFLLFAQLDYYNSYFKHQFRETSQAMVDFQPLLPVYAMQFNDTKYNVYFAQQSSELVATDIAEFESRLADEDLPPLFWLAGGHLYTPPADAAERYGLVELARVEHRATAAALLLNPAVAEQLTVRPGAADGAARYSVADLPVSNFSTRLLVAVRVAEQEAVTGELKIELLAEDNRVISEYVTAAGKLPVVLPVGMLAAGTGLRISLPPGAAAPEVWLLP